MRFGSYLADALERAGLSQSAFAEKIAYQQQNVNQIIKGKRAPPLKHVEAWANCLVKHIDREEFLDLAHWEHCTPRIQKLITELQQNKKRAPKRST